MWACEEDERLMVREQPSDRLKVIVSVGAILRGRLILDSCMLERGCREVILRRDPAAFKYSVVCLVCIAMLDSRTR
jgi:hypothetical protein